MTARRTILVLGSDSTSRMVRYYCVCGSVRYPDGYRVENDGRVKMLRHNHQSAQGFGSCAGGYADPVEDRAP